MTNTNKGGYQILDLGNVDLTTSPTIPGLYELIEGTKKPVRLSRINLGGVEKHDIVSMPVVSGSDYVFENVYGYDLSIDSNGNLSLASTKWATKAEIEAGTLDNAKPIYIHPININKGSDNNQGSRFTLFIFNNSSTPIDTIAKLETEILRIYELAGATIRILVNGGFYDSDNSRMIVANFIGYGGGNYYLSGIDTGGYARVLSNASLNDLLGTPEQVNDGVNKLN